MNEPSTQDHKDIYAGTTPRTESPCLYLYILWSLNKLLPVFGGIFFPHTPLNSLKTIKYPLWTGWRNGKIDLVSILLMRSDNAATSGQGGRGTVIRWDGSSCCCRGLWKRKLPDISFIHCLFANVTSKKYLYWLVFLFLYASKNLLSSREMEKKPALLNCNGQSCSNKPKCLKTALLHPRNPPPIPHLPCSHDHLHS